MADGAPIPGFGQPASGASLATDAALFGIVALLNAALALLILGSRPRRREDGYVAAFVATKAAVCAVWLAVLFWPPAGDPLEPISFVNLLTVVAALPMAFLLPRRRVGRRGELALVALGALWSASPAGAGRPTSRRTSGSGGPWW